MVYGITSLQMCLLWTFSIPFLVKPVSSVKGTRLLRRRSSAYFRRNHWKIIGVSENQADLELQPPAYCTDTITLQGEHAILLRAPRSTNTGTGNDAFQDAPFHNCSSVSPPSALYRIRANSTGVPHATINAVKREWFLKSTLRTSLQVHLTAATPLLRALPRMKCISAYSRNVYLFILSTDLQNNYNTERTTPGCTYSSLADNA